MQQQGCRTGAFCAVIATALLAAPFAAGAMVGYWDFESAATPFVDASGNGYSATPFGSPTRTTAPADVRVGTGALRIDPVASQYLRLPDMTSQFGAQSATLAFWVRLVEAVPSLQTTTGLESFGSGAINPYPASHYPWTDGTAYLTTFRATTRVNSIALRPEVNRTQWHHIAITTMPGAGNWKLYQDGQLVTSAAGDWFLNTAPELGRSTYGSTYYMLNGYVDDVRLYNVALTQPQIMDLIPEPASALLLAGACFAGMRCRRHT